MKIKIKYMDSLENIINKITNKEQNKTPEKKQFIVSTILQDGRIIELVYSEKNRETKLAVFDGSNVEYLNKIEISGHIISPYPQTNNLINKKVIRFPSEAKEYGSDKELIEQIQKFIHRYLDISQTFEKIASYYVLFTWVYDRFNELPYLRAIGDWGSGKSRLLQVIGSLCYKPIFAGGATTTSPIFRIINEIQGTVVLDEADYRFSDMTTDIVKILNCGYQKGMPVLRSEGNGNSKFDVKAYDVFCPKIIATRKQFGDQALESRFLIIEMEKTNRDDMPINLPDSFDKEALELRNQLLMWRFKNFNKVSLKQDFIDRTVEPRLNQIVIPLLSIIEDNEVRDEIKKSVREYNQELSTDRGMSLEAEILNALVIKYEAGYLEPTMKELSEAHAEQQGLIGKDVLTPRKVGNIIRKQLKLKIKHLSNGHVVPEMENKQRLLILRQKYDVLEDSTAVNVVNKVNIVEDKGIVANEEEIDVSKINF